MDIKIGTGEIPLDELCFRLKDRHYGKELTIQYIKQVYNQDVGEEINSMSMYFKDKGDIFKNFHEECPSNIGYDKLDLMASYDESYNVLLNLNPLKYIRKYRYMALDYLKYLEFTAKKNIIEKHGIDKIKNNRDASKSFIVAFNKEMQDFYNLITISYENEIQHIL